MPFFWGGGGESAYHVQVNAKYSILSDELFYKKCMNPHYAPLDFAFYFARSLQIVYIIKINSVIRHSCRKRELKTCKQLTE